ncbi:MAG: hypothetical protein WC192_00305 [Candidatus Babeliales bacterium]
MMKFKKSLALFVFGLATLLGISGCADNQPERPVYTQTVQPSATYKNNASCGYIQPIQGYGEISKTTGRVRTKVVSGHWRHTSNGYKYIKPYARS